MAKPAMAETIPIIAIWKPDLTGIPTVILALYHPMKKSVIVLTTSETITPRKISVPTKMKGIKGIKDPTTAAIPTSKALFLA